MGICSDSRMTGQGIYHDLQHLLTLPVSLRRFTPQPWEHVYLPAILASCSSTALQPAGFHCSSLCQQGSGWWPRIRWGLCRSERGRRELERQGLAWRASDSKSCASREKILRVFQEGSDLSKTANLKNPRNSPVKTPVDKWVTWRKPSCFHWLDRDR